MILASLTRMVGSLQLGDYCSVIGAPPPFSQFTVFVEADSADRDPIGQVPKFYRYSHPDLGSLETKKIIAVPVWATKLTFGLIARLIPPEHKLRNVRRIDQP